MESLVKFLIRNMNPDPDEEENISSDMEDAAFRVRGVRAHVSGLWRSLEKAKSFA